MAKRGRSMGSDVPTMTADALVDASSARYFALARNVKSPGSARSMAATRRISTLPSPSRPQPSRSAISLSFKGGWDYPTILVFSTLDGRPPSGDDADEKQHDGDDE